MWGHGRSLPSPPPAAAEAEGGGEPAWETPSGARGSRSQAHPQQSTPGSLCGPSSNPSACPQGTVHNPPGAIPGRPTCLSIDLKTRYRSRLVRISPALPNVKPCGEGHATGRRLVRGPAGGDTAGKGRGVSTGAGHQSRKPGFKAWRPCSSNSDHQQSWEDLVLTSTLRLPNQPPNQPAAHHGSTVSLPTPASLSQESGPATEEAGELFHDKGIRL